MHRGASSQGAHESHLGACWTRGPVDQHVTNLSQFAQHLFSFDTRCSVFLEPGETTLALVPFPEVLIQCSGVGPGNLPFYQISLVTFLCTKVWESSQICRLKEVAKNRWRGRREKGGFVDCSSVPSCLAEMPQPFPEEGGTLSGTAEDNTGCTSQLLHPRRPTRRNGLLHYPGKDSASWRPAVYGTPPIPFPLSTCSESCQEQWKMINPNAFCGEASSPFSTTGSQKGRRGQVKAVKQGWDLFIPCGSRSVSSLPLLEKTEPSSGSTSGTRSLILSQTNSDPHNIIESL